MKSPASPTRFQATHRHYHRHQSTSSSWDQWVDNSKAPKEARALGTPKGRKVLGIILGVLAFACVIGVMVYQMK